MIKLPAIAGQRNPRSGCYKLKSKYFLSIKHSDSEPRMTSHWQLELPAQVALAEAPLKLDSGLQKLQ